MTIMVKTRDQIITSMCYTFRHDYGLPEGLGNGYFSELSSGITDVERRALRQSTAQIFDNDIVPVFQEHGIDIYNA